MKKLDPTTKNKIDNLIKTAKKDKYALIIRERDKWFTEHNLKAIYKAYPCTGILVKSTQPGKAYHVTDINNTTNILENGLKPCESETATFGTGVIYAYPSIENYSNLDKNAHAVFEIEYTKGTLQALATFDKSEQEQHEILIKPEQITSIRQIDF